MVIFTDSIFPLDVENQPQLNQRSTDSDRPGRVHSSVGAAAKQKAAASVRKVASGRTQRRMFPTEYGVDPRREEFKTHPKKHITLTFKKPTTEKSCIPTKTFDSEPSNMDFAVLTFTNSNSRGKQTSVDGMVMQAWQSYVVLLWISMPSNLGQSQQINS